MRSQTSRWVRAVVAGVAGVVAIPFVMRAQKKDAPTEAPEVHRVVLTGVDRAFKADLEKSIATHATQCKNIVVTVFCLFSGGSAWNDRSFLDQKEFERDVLRIRGYLWMRGFREATVDTSVVEGGRRGVIVTFTVHANRPTLIGRIAVDYDSTLIPEKRIQRIAPLKAGAPFDIDRLDSMRVNYANEMWNRGYGDAIVDTATVVDDSVAYTADLHLRLIPNHHTTVGPIVITGLAHLSRQTVLNSLSFHTGDPFRRDDQLTSQRTLYESNLFRSARITVLDTGPPARRDSVKEITIQLREANLRDVRVGAGFSNIDFLETEAHFTNYNLLGDARRLNIDGTVGNLLAGQLGGRAFFFDPTAFSAVGDSSNYLAPTWSVSSGLTQPAFLRQPKDQLGVTAFAHRQSTPGIFIDQGYGAAVTFTRQVRVRVPVSLTYRFEINRVSASDVYFCLSYGVCDTLTIGALRAHRALAPLALTAFIDRSDVPLDPTQGYTVRVDLQHASSVTASDYHYDRASLDAGAYAHQGANVFAAHLRLGIVRALSSATPALGVLQPSTRFYAGGANSVRGFGENQLGPRILTIDPLKLAAADSGGTSSCAATSEAIRNCDPNNASIPNSAFLPQALGGTSVIEGSIEWRFPTPIYQKVTGAVFLDGAVVGQSALKTLQDIQSIAHGSGAITPGVGLRYRSPVGPIRFDVGFNPNPTENLPVVTEIVENGQRKIIPLLASRRWASSGTSILDRLTLHFSIGQAY